MNIKITAKFKQGFSLLEVAIGLLILGLSLTYFSGIFQLISETEREKSERVNIHKVQGALNTFLAVNMFLPCPDTDNDGHEDRTGIQCSEREGYLPYKDLGIEGRDAWGNPYYYRVNDFANTAAVNEICQSASVIGKSGPVDSGLTGLLFCPKTNMYYCDAPCSDVCDVACSHANSIDPPPIIDPRPNISDVNPNLREAPFFHLVTPPSGSNPGEGNLVMNDENGDSMGSGIVAVIVSWGANGSSVYRYDDATNCGGGTVAENINCSGSSFVDTKTGENRDFITWISVNQAKMALIYNGEFR